VKAAKKRGVALGTERPADLNPRPTRPSPTDRLAEMTREHVDSLDQERQRLLDQVDRVRGELDRLLPENARLKEALDNGATNGAIASVLITVGGAAISYAAFIPSADRAVATAGAAALLAGVVILVVSSIRGRRGGS
jgi:hypothetical protein